MNFRNFFVGIVFLVLLIGGPVNHLWPFWLLIRISYLIIVPLLVWFLLGWFWSKWQPTKETETLINRCISGIISLLLFILAFREAISKTHIGNTHIIQTRDGIEEVGEDILLKGPDWVMTFSLGLLAIIFMVYSILGTKLAFSKKKKL